MRKNVWIQQGTIFTPNIELKRNFQKYRAHCQRKNINIFITSGNDSDHSMGSMHYSDDAVDVAHNGVSITIMRSFFGKDFDVVECSWGYHIEYDPE